MRFSLAAAIAALTCASLAFAQSRPAARPAAAAPVAAATGRITGKVTQKNGDPLQSVNVIVLGTKQGAATDENGNFTIVGVAVGTQQLKAMALGVDPQTQSVTVNAGQTANVHFVMGESKTVKTLEEIQVTAEKKIDTKSSTTKQSISAEKLKDIPVDNLKDAVGVKAGIVAQGGELHFRGGRGGEVKFQFSGVEVSDPLFGNSANIANLAVAGTDILSGGFDAEYGNALSGVVSVTTKEGTDRFGGEVRWDTDRYGDPTKTFDNYDRFTFGFGGPTPIKNLTYFATYEGTFQDTYLKTTMDHPRRTLLDFIQLGNRQDNEINTNFKLAWRINTPNKITFETINNRSINTPYNHMWSREGFVGVRYDTVRTAGQPPAYTPVYGSWYPSQPDSATLRAAGYTGSQAINMPDHVPTVDNRFNQETAVWTNQSTKNAWTTRLSLLQFHTLQSVGQQQPWEYWIQSPFYWSGNVQTGTENNPYFATHGDFPVYSKLDQTSWNLKSDYSTSQWKQHQVKTGIEVKYNKVQNLTLNLPNSETNGLPGGSRSDFVNFNPEGAAYVQDRWEFEGLVLNAGVRYDLFTPGEQVQDSDLKSGKRYKAQFSPRLGIAYPISDKDVLSFHYGWTYQTPASNFVFQNRGISTSVAVRGNPDLEPETNIAYQAGVQHLFSKDISGQFSVFFKDIYGLITVRQERDEFGNLVNVYFNGDYASSRGFEASIEKSFSHKFSAEVNYTYSLATGVASDPNSALQFFNGGRLYLPIAEQPLDWDQRHTLSLQAVVRDPGKWGFRMLWLYGSGFPFTPAFRNDRRPDPSLTNSRRLPSTARLTIDGDKFYKVWGQNVTLFFDARNVLDAKNISGLSQGAFPNPFVNTAGDDYTIYYTETGRAGGAYLQDVNGDNILDWNAVHDPRVFEEGRSVRLGVSVTF
ncbi:MAG TPA: TonB-dependent receptor [Candidatus Eisenbacteria bacterium]|nr:TonB-dependent receptor [Candidatus Eisenbacteria bacterium]